MSLGVKNVVIHTTNALSRSIKTIKTLGIGITLSTLLVVYVVNCVEISICLSVVSYLNVAFFSWNTDSAISVWVKEQHISIVTLSASSV